MKSRSSYILLIIAALASILYYWHASAGSQDFSGRSGSTGAEATSRVKETMEASFSNDVLRCKQPVLVDFYATWCGPCKAMAPVIDQLAKSYAGKVVFFRADVDKNPRLVESYGITGIPAMGIFKNGHLVGASVGVVPEEKLHAKIDKVLEK